MNPLHQNDSLITLKRLSASDDYYNVVFKKTERIASAVFYILSHVELTDRNRVHYDSVSTRAMSLHTTVIDSLNLYEYQVTDKLYPLQQALVTLGSTLKMATAAGLITIDIETVLDDEIDVVLRHLRHHYVGEGVSRPSLTTKPTPSRNLSPRPNVPRRTRPNIPANDFSSDAVMVYSDLGDRTARIKTVLSAKPDATIKDLSDIITDVSTKTIQRDLNSLIERGEVIRQGERRWSRYSVLK